jgi:hypothetical protein
MLIFQIWRKVKVSIPAESGVMCMYTYTIYISPLPTSSSYAEVQITRARKVENSFI